LTLQEEMKEKWKLQKQKRKKINRKFGSPELKLIQMKFSNPTLMSFAIGLHFAWREEFNF